MTTRFAGVAWDGSKLRGLGMLSPLIPAARAVPVGPGRLAWLAKDGTVVSAQQRGDQLVLTWPRGDAALVAQLQR